MPNHCYNSLLITGPKDDLLAFHDAIDFTSSEDSGIFRAFLPFPTELKGAEMTDADGKTIGTAFTDEGYSWCLANWGTKWGDYDTYIQADPHDAGDNVWEVQYVYETAWSPGLEAIQAIALMFPTLTFRNYYEELGMGFIGYFTAHGALTSDKYTQDLPSWPDYNLPDEEADKANEAYHEAMNLIRDQITS